MEASDWIALAAILATAATAITGFLTQFVLLRRQRLESRLAEYRKELSQAYELRVCGPRRASVWPKTAWLAEHRAVCASAY